MTENVLYYGNNLVSHLWTICLRCLISIVGRGNDMKRFFILIPVIFLGACVQAPYIDLTPQARATASDPAWIRELDAEMVKLQTKSQAEHRGSLDSQILLWQALECTRGVKLAQARAAHTIAKRKGISRGDAIAETQTDPGWTLAAQRCGR